MIPAQKKIRMSRRTVFKEDRTRTALLHDSGVCRGEYFDFLFLSLDIGAD
jgi:hypothetical protein